MRRQSTIEEIWEFLKARKKWWLFPTILFLFLFASLIIYVFSSVLAPVLYPLF